MVSVFCSAIFLLTMALCTPSNHHTALLSYFSSVDQKARAGTMAVITHVVFGEIKAEKRVICSELLICQAIGSWLCEQVPLQCCGHEIIRFLLAGYRSCVSAQVLSTQYIGPLQTGPEYG